MENSRMQQFTDGNFEAEVLRSDRPTLIDFWAPGCGPCRALAPIVDALAERYAGRVKFGTLDIDRNQRIATQLGIRAIPAVLVFRRGEVVSQHVGAGPRTREQLEAALQKALA
jgi:thioredoxin 1